MTCTPVQNLFQAAKMSPVAKTPVKQIYSALPSAATRTPPTKSSSSVSSPSPAKKRWLGRWKNLKITSSPNSASDSLTDSNANSVQVSTDENQVLPT